MDEDVNEKIRHLNKKLLELEKRVDIKLKESEKKIDEKTDKILRQEMLLTLGLYIKTMEELKKILKILQTNILILGILVAFLYVFIILLTLKLI